MNNVVKTQFAGRSPFKKPVQEVDLTTLKITDDQPKGRMSRSYKYDSLFRQLAPGKSVSCKPENCDLIAQALRSYAERKNKKWKVSMSKWYTSTTGRVFVLEKK